MTEIDNIQAVIATAKDTTPPQRVEPGNLYLAPASNGGREVWDFTGDEYLPRPKRKTGNVYVDDLDSFLAYFQKHSTADSEIYVNLDEAQITAVLDAHTRDGADWGQHRLTLRMQATDRWADWTKHDRQPFRQVAFAEFIEDHLDDIREPAAATMLEIAQTFEGATKVTFSTGVTLSNGDRRLQWEEKTDATAGKLDVPTHFTIGVAPFDFADPFEINARFRYRVSSGELYITYLLDDPAAVVRDAVLDVVTKLEADLTPNGSEEPSHRVMRGIPA